jgi:hypothetical protein
MVVELEFQVRLKFIGQVCRVGAGVFHQAHVIEAGES